MNLDDIRKMNDGDLREFLYNMKNKNACNKCGNIIDIKDKKTINVAIYNYTVGQKQKKLCCLCNECYVDLLDHLGVPDIDWED